MASQALNMFSCDAGTYSISDAIAGQTPLVMYDSLKQAALLPELRQQRSGGNALVIMPYDERTPEALFSQMEAAWGSERRTVKSKEFYTLEYDNYDTLSFVVDKSVVAVPAAGAPVTVNINALSKSTNGNYIKPLATYYAWIKEANRQLVIISAVGGTSTVTLQPTNNEVLDLTQYSRYTLIVDPLRRYSYTTAEIVSEGMVLNPPTMYKAYAQRFEKRLSEHQDEITNYVYDRDFKVLKGLTTGGMQVEYFYIPALNNQLDTLLKDNKNLNTLFGKRDSPNQIGFDGIVPQAEKYGMFNSGYEIFTNISLKQILWGMMKTLRKVNGCTDYMLAHDFNFGMDWSDSIAGLVKAADQSYRYELFGTGGTGSRNFDYYDFQTFTAFGYKFTPYMLDIFDHRRYAGILEYFALMMPLSRFKDQDGNMVPFVTYCDIMGAEPGKVDNIYSFDFRKQMKRTLDVACETTYGMEVHRPTAMGTIKKTSTN